MNIWLRTTVGTLFLNLLPFLPLAAAELTDADFAAQVAEVQRKVPNDDFTIIIEKPFVVIGDEPARTVRRRAEDTVRWSVKHIKKQYFAKDPDHVIEVWLFRDKESYDANTKLIFNDTPTTPYGYYSPQHKALLMNIGTGSGTLVHEIVHPFVATNFPGCPSWFNEGLASLYEQCGEREGRIVGYPNWRLPALQRAIRGEAAGSFETLCGTTTKQFYGDARGTMYGQARYLCYYLQEQGKLEKFYHAFVKNRRNDPTGYQTLQTILGEADMAEFQKRWEQFVLKLER